MYIVSRCLLGHNCKYNGGNNRNDEVIEFCKAHDYVTICPETEGGLGTPRTPAEIVKDSDGNISVITRDGHDVTREFTEGAKRSLSFVMKELKARGEDARIEGAILKACSPSCGSGVIYDGTFTGTKTEGSGIFTDLLMNASGRARGFHIVDENGLSKLVDE